MLITFIQVEIVSIHFATNFVKLISKLVNKYNNYYLFT